MPRLQFFALLQVLALASCPVDFTPPDPPIWVERIAPFPSGSRVALACSDGTIRIVDTDKGEVERTIHVVDGNATALVVSPRGDRIAYGVRDESKKHSYEVTDHPWHWSVIDLEAVPPGVRTPLPDRMGWESYARFSIDGKRLLMWSYQAHVDCPLLRRGSGRSWESADVFDSTTGRKLFELKDPDEPINCAAWSEATDQIVTGGANGSIRVWRASTGESLQPVRIVGTRTECLEISPDGSRMFCGSDDTKGTIWKMPGLALEKEFKASSNWLIGDSILFAQWTRDGERIVFSTGDCHTVECRDRSGNLLWMHDFDGSGDEEPLHASCDPSGTYADCWRFQMPYGRVFDSRTGECRMDLPQVSEYCNQIAWTGDGRKMLAIGKQGLDIVPIEAFSPTVLTPVEVMRLELTPNGLVKSTRSL